MKLISELLKLREAEVIDAPEDEQPKKPTKTKQKPDLGNLGGFDQPKFDQPLSRQDDNKEVPPQKPAQKSHRTASRAETDRATRGINMNDDAMKHLSDLHRNMPAPGENPEYELDPDVRDGEVDVPRPPETLPKVISHALKAAGFVDPNFHLVSNLPGNMSMAIRQLGKSLFSTLTTTPTNKISMVGNLMGQGPNSDKEIQAIAKYVKEFGEDLGPGNIDFDAIMPGYSADIHNFRADGIHYLLVRDFMGQYVYCWPADTSITHKMDAKLKHEPRKLK